MEIMNPIVSLVLQEARKSTTKEVKMLYGVKEQVEEMKIELQWMQSFLEDADRRVSSQSQQRQSRVFRQWVLQVKEASLDAEDIVDTYLVKLALRKRSGVINFIKRYGCILKRGRDIHVVGLEIEALNSKLSRLRLRLQTYGVIRELGSASSSRGFAKPLQRRSYGHIQDRNVVGLEDNTDEVVDLLLQAEQGCEVVSIYGMGGLGKTTLAKKVYNDKRVRTHFDKFAWVYVSQQFKARDVWESILKQLAFGGGDQLSDEQLAAKLYQVQKDHQCLVVVDDIWSIEDWDKLRVGFPLEETRFSRILFTTRKEGVSKNANTRSSYGGLKCLKDPEDMNLLKKIVFQGRDREIADKEMLDLLRGMLHHCAGLPLAITVLGGILASKDCLSEWQTIHDNINPYLRRGKGHDEEQGLGVNQVLAYSYYDLPSQLKTCFLYLSQFPEDYEIETRDLMRMWIAEGFVSVEYDGEGEETVEDVVELYVNELVGRCVVELGKKNCTGRIQTVRLHDLMRDVCLSKAKEESLIHSYESDAVPKGKVRRLSYIGVEDKKEHISLSGYETYSHIRSLVIRYACPVSLAIRFELLRMLLLEKVNLCYMKGISKEITKLIHLRYLSLRGSAIFDWPSLDKMGSMETLDLRVMDVESKLPLKLGEIWKMKLLRHLYLPSHGVKYSTYGDNMAIESNSNLQTLVNFSQQNGEIDGILIKFPNMRRLRLWQGEYMRKLWEILKNNKGVRLNRLHSFSIIYCSGLHNEKVDLEAVLNTCPQVYKLRLDGPIDKFPQPNQFPTKLTKLTLRWSEIEDPKHIETTLGKLPQLRSLYLWSDAFKGEQLSFKKHTFPQLTTLSLFVLRELRNWTVEEGAMSNLERLKVHNVCKLEAIPGGLRFIATLKELEISYMPAEFKASLMEGGADFDTVKHVPSVTFMGCD